MVTGGAKLIAKMSVSFVIEAIQGTKLKRLERYLSKQDPYVVFKNSAAGISRKTDTHWDSSSEPVCFIL